MNATRRTLAVVAAWAIQASVSAQVAGPADGLSNERPTTFAQAAQPAVPDGSGALRAVVSGNPKDPFESWNRKVFGFNDAIDNAVLKPVATAYRDYVPEVVRAGVGNFLGNFSDAWSTVNHLLQGKLQTGMEMFTRVMVNTVFGLGGLLDISTEAGLERRDEDFGQTLGRWGVPAGPYLVWPLLGPSSVRETAALPLDRGIGPGLVINDGGVVAGLALLGVVDTRAGLLRASRLLDDVALDRYVFVRDAYLSRRRSQVYDGNPPDEDEPAQDKAPKRSDAAPDERGVQLADTAPAPALSDASSSASTHRAAVDVAAPAVSPDGWHTDQVGGN
jgi:phospholipid-binding lipoprotein MlaA